VVVPARFLRVRKFVSLAAEALRRIWRQSHHLAQRKHGPRLGRCGGCGDDDGEVLPLAVNGIWRILWLAPYTHAPSSYHSHLATAPPRRLGGIFEREALGAVVERLASTAAPKQPPPVQRKWLVTQQNIEVVLYIAEGRWQALVREILECEQGATVVTKVYSPSDLCSLRLHS
jgi:hypothetical protein